MSELKIRYGEPTPYKILSLIIPMLQDQSFDMRTLLDEFERMRSELNMLRGEITMLRKEIREYIRSKEGGGEEKDEKHEEEGLVELKTIPLAEAKSKVLEYVRKHPGCWTSDIVVDLGIDVDVVLRALEELKNERKVE